MTGMLAFTPLSFNSAAFLYCNEWMLIPLNTSSFASSGRCGFCEPNPVAWTRCFAMAV